MTDKKPTDNEIIRAFKRITEYKGFTSSASKTLKSTLDLINRLQAQNEDLSETVHNLTIEKDTLFDKAEELKAEVERLYIALEENQKATKFWKDKSETIKAEAYKEFAEEIFELFPADKCNTVISRVTVKHILKELVGEDK